MGVIAGPYTVTHNAVSLGTLIEEGFNIEFTAEKELVTADNLGASVQDGVHRGGQCFISFTMMEYDQAQVKLALWPYGAVGNFGQVGRLDSNIISQIVLTAVAGTPAAAEPATLTIPRAILAENFNVNLLFATRARKIPIRLRCLPDSSGVWFTFT